MPTQRIIVYLINNKNLMINKLTFKLVWLPVTFSILLLALIQEANL